MRHLKLVIAVSLLLSVGLLLWPGVALFDTPDEAPPQDRQAKANYYDYYIEDLVLIGVDTSGMPYRLTAKRMERYEAEDRSELFEPHLSQRLAEPPRTIRANRGRISDRESVLELHDNVVLISGLPNGPQEITTSQRMQIDLR